MIDLAWNTTGGATIGPNRTTSAVHETSNVSGTSGSPRQCADVVDASHAAGLGGSGCGAGAGAGGAGVGVGAGGAGFGFVVAFDDWTDGSVRVGPVGEVPQPHVRTTLPTRTTAATVEFVMAVTTAIHVLTLETSGITLALSKCPAKNGRVN